MMIRWNSNRAGFARAHGYFFPAGGDLLNVYYGITPVVTVGAILASITVRPLMDALVTVAPALKGTIKVTP